MNRFTDAAFDQKELVPISGYQNEKLVTLEEAVRPVEQQVPCLDQSIAIAKKQQFPATHGLTLDEAAAIYLYTMEGGSNCFYRILNVALRSKDRNSIKLWFSYLKLFDTALNKLPKVKQCIWRGVLNEVQNDFENDKILVWWGVTSCSITLKVIENFLGSTSKSTLFMIEASNGRSIKGYSQFDLEDEVILRPGTQLLVKSNAVPHAGDLRVVHLIEKDSNDNGQSPSTASVDQRKASCGGRAYY